MSNPKFTTTVQMRFYTINRLDYRLVFGTNPTDALVVQIAGGIEEGARVNADIFGPNANPVPPRDPTTDPTLPPVFTVDGRRAHTHFVNRGPPERVPAHGPLDR